MKVATILGSCVKVRSGKKEGLWNALASELGNMTHSFYSLAPGSLDWRTQQNSWEGGRSSSVGG